MKKVSIAPLFHANCPLVSTFICGPYENAVQTLSVLLLPSFFHIALFHRVLFTSWFNVSNLLIVIFLPILLLRFVQRKGALWWLGKDADLQENILSLLTTVSLIVLTGCFEYRVVLTSLYNIISLFPPWSYLFVTVGVYSVVGLIAAHFTGHLG